MREVNVNGDPESGIKIWILGVSSGANRVATGYQPSEEERRWLVYVSGEPESTDRHTTHKTPPRHISDMILEIEFYWTRVYWSSRATEDCILQSGLSENSGRITSLFRWTLTRWRVNLATSRWLSPLLYSTLPLHKTRWFITDRSINDHVKYQAAENQFDQVLTNLQREEA